MKKPFLKKEQAGTATIDHAAVPVQNVPDWLGDSSADEQLASSEPTEKTGTDVLEVAAGQEPAGDAAAVPEKPEKDVPVSFAHGLNFYKLFWIFMIGSFLGVVLETMYCLITRHHFESRRSLIYGPFNLVYGFGALAMTLGLHWLIGKRDLWLFTGGFIIGSAFEYLCSWLQETVFGTVSWQYDNMPLNINGRITLQFSFFWGILALLFVKEIYPRLSMLIEKIPNKLGVTLTWILFVFMLANTTISGMAVYRMSQRQADIPATTAVDRFLDKEYPDYYLKQIYPNMTFLTAPKQSGKQS